jgi:hypothetical protein
MDIGPAPKRCMDAPWYINADWIWLYADNTDGKTKTLVLVANKIYELDPNTATNDDGVAFQTTIASGEIKFGDNDEFASVLDVTFEFLRSTRQHQPIRKCQYGGWPNPFH